MQARYLFQRQRLATIDTYFIVSCTGDNATLADGGATLADGLVAGGLGPPPAGASLAGGRLRAGYAGDAIARPGLPAASWQRGGGAVDELGASSGGGGAAALGGAAGRQRAAGTTALDPRSSAWWAAGSSHRQQQQQEPDDGASGAA